MSATKNMRVCVATSPGLLIEVDANRTGPEATGLLKPRGPNIICPPSAAVAYIRARRTSGFPQTAFMVWPGSGHFPHLAHPQRFAECLAATAWWGGER